MRWYKQRIELGDEVVYELITADDECGFGVAIADIMVSEPHFHVTTHETYILLDGAAVIKLRKPVQSHFLLDEAGIRSPDQGIGTWRKSAHHELNWLSLLQKRDIIVTRVGGPIAIPTQVIHGVESLTNEPVRFLVRSEPAWSASDHLGVTLSEEERSFVFTEGE